MDFLLYVCDANKQSFILNEPGTEHILLAASIIPDPSSQYDAYPIFEKFKLGTPQLAEHHNKYF